jgi:hypothetical protein
MPDLQNLGRRDIQSNVPRILPVRISRLLRLSLRRQRETAPTFGRRSNEICGSQWLDPGIIPDFEIGVSPQTNLEISMEQFVHQQMIAAQTDNN